MKKTALSQLFNEIEKYQITNEKIPNEVRKRFYDKERKTIEETYEQGKYNGFSHYDIDTTGEDYFKRTFEQ